jgi:hypothetical protein
VDDRLGTVAKVELGQDPADVGLDSLVADGQAGGDLRIGQSFRDHPQDLHFAGGQGLDARRPGHRAVSEADDLGNESSGHRRGQKGVAGVHDSNGAGQFVGGHVLEQEAAGPGGQGVVDVLVEVECGQHDDPRPTSFGREPTGYARWPSSGPIWPRGSTAAATVGSWTRTRRRSPRSTSSPDDVV